MSDSDSSDDFQTPRRRPAQSQTADHSAQLIRLEGVSRQFARRARMIREQPDAAATMARELVRNFTARRQAEGTLSPVRRVRGRPTMEFRIRFTCLQSPSTVNVCRLNLEALRNLGLGIPPHELRGRVARGWSKIQLHWDETEMKNYIVSLFPALQTVGFSLALARRGGRLEKLPAEVLSARNVKDHVMQQNRHATSTPPVLYVIPDEEIAYRPLGTPTVLARLPAESSHAEPDTETLPVSLNPDAPAATALTTTTRERRPVSNAPQEPLANDIQTSVLETRRIRAEQDRAYEESLRVDRERALLQRAAEEQQAAEEENRQRVAQARETHYQQVRNLRRAALPDQPDNGFTVRVRLPEGNSVTRRFLPDMDVDSLVCFIGSQETSTERFRIRIPGRVQMLDSDLTDVALRELGITSSVAIDVQWENSDPVPHPQVSDNDREEGDHSNEATQSSDGEVNEQTDTRREPPIPAEPDQAAARDVANASQQQLLITVSRINLVKDLLAAFRDDSITDKSLKIKVENESAEDFDGVFRDVLTEFWGKLMSLYFDGEDQASPIISPELKADDWRAVGSIIYKGFAQVGYFPLRFSVTSLIFAVLGRQQLTPDILISSFLGSLGNFERELFSECLELSEFSSEQINDIVECLERYGVRQLPTPNNLRAITIRCSEVVSVERSLFPLQCMNLGRLLHFPEFRAVEEIKKLLERLKPNPRKVSEMIAAEPSNQAEERVFGFLRRAIRSFTDELLLKFLRFVGGSDTLNFAWITVQFVRLEGLSRRIISHTCTHTIDLPVNYVSYNEFLMELKNQLSSDVWAMDIV